MGAYRIRQLPGKWNALGEVKFLFPNQYDVYLHDTPGKNLFDRTVRTFSHGCIRVKNPLQLAQLLLGGEENGWSVKRIDDIIASGENNRIALSPEVPINILYRTAWVEADGTVEFRPDVYGRDAAMAKVLRASGYDEATLLGAVAAR